MEYKRIWMPYKLEQNIDNSGQMTIVTHSPVDNNDTLAAESQVKTLLKSGWKIVSTCPVIGSMNVMNSEGDDLVSTFTKGIEIFLVKE